MTRFMMAGLFSSPLSAVKVFICSFSDIITRIVNGITCNDTTHYWVAAHVETNGVSKRFFKVSQIMQERIIENKGLCMQLSQFKALFKIYFYDSLSVHKYQKNFNPDLKLLLWQIGYHFIVIVTGHFLPLFIAILLLFTRKPY